MSPASVCSLEAMLLSLSYLILTASPGLDVGKVSNSSSSSSGCTLSAWDSEIFIHQEQEVNQHCDDRIVPAANAIEKYADRSYAGKNRANPEIIRLTSPHTPHVRAHIKHILHHLFSQWWLSPAHPHRNNVSSLMPQILHLVTSQGMKVLVIENSNCDNSARIKHLPGSHENVGMVPVLVPWLQFLSLNHINSQPVPLRRQGTVWWDPGRNLGDIKCHHSHQIISLAPLFISNGDFDHRGLNLLLQDSENLVPLRIRILLTVTVASELPEVPNSHLNKSKRVKRRPQPLIPGDPAAAEHGRRLP
nr:hypothetical protein SETIT_3G002300v2 [Ipomoea batatas]